MRMKAETLVELGGNGKPLTPPKVNGANGQGLALQVHYKIREVDFAQLTDGTLVELIEHPEDADRTALVVWKDGTAKIRESVEDCRCVLVPAPRDELLLRHIKLPRGVEPYGSAPQLRSDVEALLRRCVDLSPNYCRLLAGFVLATWLIDRLSIAPYLLLVGLPQSGKTTVLQTLALLCRRPLLTADVSTAAFYEACGRYIPTWLIDETGTQANNRLLRHLLRVGSSPNVVAMRKGKVFQSFGAKVISFVEPPDDWALNTRCLIIPMRETNKADLARPTDPEIEELAGELQKKLLLFRLERYKATRPQMVPGSETLRPRERDLLSCLLAVNPEDTSYRKFLLEGFQRFNDIHREPHPELQSAVLAALFNWIHHFTCGTSSIQIVDVTRMTNQFLEQGGHSLRLKPRKVGHVLKTLGFLDRHRTNRGWELWLSPERQREMHNLVRNHGLDHLVPWIENVYGVRPVKCQICEEMGFDTGYTIGPE